MSLAWLFRLVQNTKTERESGRKAQLSNIAAAKAVSEVVRTTLGPRAMLKMILDPMGGIQMTNDGNAILREIDGMSPLLGHAYSSFLNKSSLVGTLFNTRMTSLSVSSSFVDHSVSPGCQEYD